MKPLFDITKLSELDKHQQLPFECEHCSNTFFAEAGRVKTCLKRKSKNPDNKIRIFRLCSKKCSDAHRVIGSTGPCNQCGKVFYITAKQERIKKWKSILFS